MKKFQLAILAISISSISGCTKELDMTGISQNYKPPMISYFDSASLENILIPSGRYLLYKDSASGTIDTIVSQIYINHVQSAGSYGQGYEYDNYRLIFSYVLDGQPDSIWYSGSADCNINSGPDRIMYDSTFDLSDELTTMPSIWYPFISADNKKYVNISSMNVEGVAYTNVHRFEATNGLSASDINYLTTIFYWVKGIGIIKRETHHADVTQTEFLVNYW